MAAVSAEARRTLFLGNLPPYILQADVQNICIPFGEIISIDLPKNFRSGESKGNAFVEFEDPEDCNAAIDNLNLAEIGGRIIRADLARPNQLSNGSHGRRKQTRAIWETEEYLTNREQQVAAESIAETTTAVSFAG